MSTLKLALITSGDPKRPDDVHKYEPPAVDPEKEVSAMLIIASLVGLAGLYLRIRVASWLAAFFTLSAYATVKPAYMDTKQMLFSAVFAGMGIGGVYVLPTVRALWGTPAAPGAGSAQE